MLGKAPVVNGMPNVKLKLKGNWTAVQMSRVIMNASKEIEIDHKDLDSLNNQRYNLREATRIQNLTNRIKQKNNKSGYKGVVFHKKVKAKPWQAKIHVNKQNISLGYYATAVEAAIAYDQAAKLYFGEFAGLNFKED